MAELVHGLAKLFSWPPVRPSLTPPARIPRRILPIPPAPAVLNQHVIDVGAIYQRSPETLYYAKMIGGGAKFENPEALGTIWSDLTLSFRSQSFTVESGAGEEPIKHDRGR